MADQYQEFVNCEAFSCLRQSISRFLMEYQERMGVPATHPVAVQACLGHFNLSLTPNQCLGIVVLQIAQDVVRAMRQ